MGAVRRTAGRMSRYRPVRFGGCPWSGAWSWPLPSCATAGVLTFFLGWDGGSTGKRGGCSRSIRCSQEELSPLLGSSLPEVGGSWCPCRVDGSPRGRTPRGSAGTKKIRWILTMFAGIDRHSTFNGSRHSHSRCTPAEHRRGTPPSALLKSLRCVMRSNPTNAECGVWWYDMKQEYTHAVLR